MMRILVVDDLADTVEMVCTVFERLGYDMRSAMTGADAIACAASWSPELALIDVILPDLVGIEVGAILRHRNHDAIYLAAFTGQADAELLVRVFNAGFDDFLLKPAPVERFQRLAMNAQRHRGLDAAS